MTHYVANVRQAMRVLDDERGNGTYEKADVEVRYKEQQPTKRSLHTRLE